MTPISTMGGLGLNREVLVGRKLSGELACYTEIMFGEYVAVCEGGKAKDVEFHGASMWLRQQIVPMRGGVAVFSRDITTDRDNLAQLSRANRKLRMLSRIHETLARRAVEPDMLQAICEIVAEDKTHQAVSIAYLQAGASVFRLIAIASTEDGYHEEMRRAIADVDDGEQTASRAVRTGVPQVARHPAPAAPGSAREDLTSVPRRCASELALPVRVHGKAIGVLSILSREPEAFDAEEVSLFADIADAAGFGIAHCRTAAERDGQGPREGGLRHPEGRALSVADRRHHPAASRAAGRLGISGRPEGSEILLEARILAVADTVETIASHRPYRPSAGIESALRQIEADRGRALDADAVHACLKLFRERRFSFSEDA
jgi:hypothetical protein